MECIQWHIKINYSKIIHLEFSSKKNNWNEENEIDKLKKDVKSCIHQLKWVLLSDENWV